MPDLHVVNAEDIEEIIDDIQPMLVGQPRLHVILAMLTIALGLYNPDLTSDQLKKGIMDASEWMSTYVDNQPLPKERMN